jgi:hypothetical protein
MLFGVAGSFTADFNLPPAMVLVFSRAVPFHLRPGAFQRHCLDQVSGWLIGNDSSKTPSSFQIENQSTGRFHFG